MPTYIPPPHGPLCGSPPPIWLVSPTPPRAPLQRPRIGPSEFTCIPPTKTNKYKYKQTNKTLSKFDGLVAMLYKHICVHRCIVSVAAVTPHLNSPTAYRPTWGLRVACSMVELFAELHSAVALIILPLSMTKSCCSGVVNPSHGLK